MASKKNSVKNDPYTFQSMGSLKFMQASYFSTATNNAHSYAQKLEMINLICFLTQKMNKSNPEKYPTCLSVLGTIFNVDFNDMEIDKHCISFNAGIVRSFGMVCDDLLWGTEDEIIKPEGITNAKEIKDKIINYFTEEWSPF